MEQPVRDIDAILREHLTESQYDAATDASPEVLCLACAGSGKSRTLAFRIARLIASGEPPESIVAFTFTEKAAESIKLRVAQALAAAGLNPMTVGAMFIGTIHSFCGNILGSIHARFNQFEVLDDNRLTLYLISRFYDLGLAPLRARANGRYFATVKEVADAWKVMNDEMIALDDVIRHDPELGNVLRNLRERMDNDQFIDFSMMIRKVVELLESENEDALRAVENLRHLIVDEYQDVNPSQEALIRALHQRSETLFVVGDDDQSIYGWRGADVQNIIDFATRYEGCSDHTLSRNFRSTEAIVAVADNFIHQELGPARVQKNPTAQRVEGPRDFRVLHFQDRRAEAEWVADRIDALLGTEYIEGDGTRRGLTPADIAILMRSTAGSEQDGTPRHAAFTAALAARGIPFTLGSGGGIFDRPQVHALREAFHILKDGQPTRDAADQLFRSTILPAFPRANFTSFTQVLSHWGRLIHTSSPNARRRVFPQQLVHELLNSFGLTETTFDAGTMADLGVFSRIMQDVESIYLSIDSAHRFREIVHFLYNVAESGYEAGTTEVLHRPDAVSVLTVHKAKGLEFPAVFITDVQRGRFPTRRSGYSGWLPQGVISDAIARGAYQNTLEDEARLFYTALTRAERYLYITGAANLPGGKRTNPPSPYVSRIQHDEVLQDPNGLPDGLVAAPPRRRLDETVIPTSFSEIKSYLRCPALYRFSQLFGFSPPISEMFGFGITVHASVGRLHQLHPNSAPTEEEAREVARGMFHLKHVAPSNDPDTRPGPYERARDAACDIVGRYSAEYGDDFTRLRQVEARFEIPLTCAVISGSIDLLLRYDEAGNIREASVLDFKTMEGGEEPLQNADLDWLELALQVQLYAHAADKVLGEAAKTGAVHLLKDNQRIQVPIDEDAVQSALANVDWAVERILAGDFPMRPSEPKCSTCDYSALCARRYEDFTVDTVPPAVHLPDGAGGARLELVRAFSDVDAPTTQP